MATAGAQMRTARERAIEALREAGEAGMSKSQLRQLIGGNPGAFRRLMQSMEDKGEITVTEEAWPTCGPTKVLRIPK